jgi:hypothetical protein
VEGLREYRLLILGAIIAMMVCSLGAGAYFGATFGAGETQTQVVETLDPNFLASRSATYALWTFWAMVVQTIVAGAAFLALLTDLRQTKRSAEAQLRAYVSVQPRVLYTYQDDTSIRATITLTNGGATPAFATWHGGNFFVGNESDAEREILRSQQAFQTLGRPAPMTIQIGQSVEGRITSHRGLTDEERTALRDGAWFFLFGITGYTDTFGREHRTTFCYRCQIPDLEFDFLMDRNMAEREVTWVITPFHNSST